MWFFSLLLLHSGKESNLILFVFFILGKNSCFEITTKPIRHVHYQYAQYCIQLCRAFLTNFMDYFETKAFIWNPVTGCILPPLVDERLEISPNCCHFSGSLIFTSVGMMRGQGIIRFAVVVVATFFWHSHFWKIFKVNKVQILALVVILSDVSIWTLICCL